VHANTPRDALARVETMVLLAGVDLPVRAIREQTSSALDLVIHLSRMKDGSRKVTQVSEVVGMEGDTITMQDLFKYQRQGEAYDAEGKSTGSLVSMGLRPKFLDKLADHGINVDVSLFRNERGAR
jgi:pilus assembly protein CpaF